MNIKDERAAQLEVAKAAKKFKRDHSEVCHMWEGEKVTEKEWFEFKEVYEPRLVAGTGCESLSQLLYQAAALGIIYPVRSGEPLDSLDGLEDGQWEVSLAEFDRGERLHPMSTWIQTPKNLRSDAFRVAQKVYSGFWSSHLAWVRDPYHVDPHYRAGCVIYRIRDWMTKPAGTWPL